MDKKWFMVIQIQGFIPWYIYLNIPQGFMIWNYCDFQWCNWNWYYPRSKLLNIFGGNYSISSCSSSFNFCFHFFFFFFLGLQERLKKLKAECGKIQLGNITVDMVMIVSVYSDVCKFTILEQHVHILQCVTSHWVITVTIAKVLGGMRGMTGLLWETSLLDPDEVNIPFNPFLKLCYAFFYILF